jgi:hypothetical protein
MAAMAESCVDTLVFTFNLRIGWLGGPVSPHRRIRIKEETIR